MRRTYDSIYCDLKDDIVDGVHPFGSLLPSQSKLVEKYHVAHNTVRKAIEQLALEGYCLPIHGKGVRVIWREPDDQGRLAVDKLETFHESAERNGLVFKLNITAFEHLTADANLAAYTGFSEGTELLHVEDVHSYKDRPYTRDIRFFTAATVEELTPAQAEESVYAFLEGVKRIRVSASRRTITVEKATSTDKELLDLNDRDSVIVITSETFDANGIMFEHRQMRGHPDLLCLHAVARRQH